MRKYGNILTALFLAVVGLYILYSKGLIFAGFESVSAKEAYRMINSDSNTIVLDVRTPTEYTNDGHIKGAILIPLQELKDSLNELKRYKESKILVYCRSGNRSVKASRILAKNGFYPINIKGGISSWKRESLPLEHGGK